MGNASTIKQSNIKILTRTPEVEAEEERLFSISNNKKNKLIFVFVLVIMALCRSFLP